VAGEIEVKVLAELEKWGLADTALGVTALDLAKRLDAPGVRPAAASMLHAQLRPTLLALEEMAPEADADDKISELTKRRNERRGA
jgi:hypothetical protein